MAVQGPQPPRKPAPVSGPGRFSQRTDMQGQPQRQLGNAEYGEQKEFADIQGGAKMNRASMGGAMPAMPKVTGLSEPTQRPDEPVTAGAPSGPGGGLESIGYGDNPQSQNMMDAKAIARYMPSLTRAANTPGVPPSFVRFVKYVREMSL
jgi:hypothetical protein